MERERLSHLIEEPGRVSREDLADLRALVERYPWFSGAQVLRAAGERASGDVLAGEPLLAAAVHVPSRSVLFDLCEPQRQEAPVKQEAPSPLPAAPPVAPKALDLHVVDAIVEAAPAEPVLPSPADDLEEVPPTVPPLAPSTPRPEDTLELGSVKEASTPTTPTPPIVEEDPLERQILEAAIASAYDLSLHAPALVEAATPPEPEVAPQEPPRAPAPVASSSLPEPAAEQVVPASGRKRFTAWLDPQAATHLPAPPPKASVPMEPAPQAPRAEQQAPVLDSKAIIDRFISQETPAPVSKATFFTPQQAAKKSLDDTAGMVTETLARIYAKQGNTAKAIEAYRKLALKYPGKSAYFAALSRELEAQHHK